MPSDVKLNGESVSIEGSLQVYGPDLALEWPDRRSASSAPGRRALVHGFQDELEVNYDNDYPNGIRLNGAVKLPYMPVAAPADTTLEGDGVTAPTDFVVGKRTSRNAAATPFKLTAAPEPDIATMFIDVENPVELIHELRRLRRAVHSLDRRLKGVEKAR